MAISMRVFTRAIRGEEKNLAETLREANFENFQQFKGIIVGWNGQIKLVNSSIWWKSAAKTFFFEVLNRKDDYSTKQSKFPPFQWFSSIEIDKLPTLDWRNFKIFPSKSASFFNCIVLIVIVLVLLDIASTDASSTHIAWRYRVLSFSSFFLFFFPSWYY